MLDFSNHLGHLNPSPILHLTESSHLFLSSKSKQQLMDRAKSLPYDTFHMGVLHISKKRSVAAYWFIATLSLLLSWRQLSEELAW